MNSDRSFPPVTALRNAPSASCSDVSTIRLLVIDDDSAVAGLVEDALAQQGVEILSASEPEQALRLIRSRHPQVVLLDLVMPGVEGTELLEKILEISPGTDVILLTGHYSTDSAVEAIQKGACDYLTKPITIEKLRQRVGRFIAEAWERVWAAQLDEELIKTYQFQGMVARSPLMLDVFARIRRVAPHFRTVLVTGPTGTGKELAARALHSLSLAPNGRFAVCNCSAVVETLFESELFGYVKGAFTGAVQDKIGLFEYANGGVLFLDEIGDLPLATQAKLLRVLQDHQVQRVGSPATRKVDVRVIAATNRDLRAMAERKQFREDLFYRLSMIEIRLPRLGDRKEDLPLLEQYFLERFSAQYGKPIRGLTRRAQALLSRYSWPGNVRELENALGHACIMVQGDMVDVADLPEVLHSPRADAVAANDDCLSLEELERVHARRMMARAGGNKVQAAAMLGISRATLYRLLAEDKEGQAAPAAGAPG